MSTKVTKTNVTRREAVQARSGDLWDAVHVDERGDETVKGSFWVDVNWGVKGIRAYLENALEDAKWKGRIDAYSITVVGGGFWNPARITVRYEGRASSALVLIVNTHRALLS